MINVPTLVAPSVVEDRLREMIDLHFDPQHGSAFWLQRADALGVDARRDVRTLDDLVRLGTMTPDDLRSKPLRHLAPRALHHQWDRLIVGQTGGTTGQGAWTAYLEEEFDEAFIAPFAAAAHHCGFPCKRDWLYVGPSGPHIIGKVVRLLARSVGSADPFSVDFDPRWAKKLPPNTLAFTRYLNHVVHQAMEVIESQEIAVIFTTPVVLSRLATTMTLAQRRAIRGVHYGGMALASEDLAHFQSECFPGAVHLSGYGNTLFGCCMEIDATLNRPLDYYPLGDRLLFEVLDAAGRALPTHSIGQVCFTRLDKSMLIVRMLERDQAELLPARIDAPSQFHHHGLRNPHSPLTLAPNQRPGLY